MPLALTSTPGLVVAVPVPNDVPTPMAITGWQGAYAFKAIITNHTNESRDAFRLTPSLLDIVYAYGFGREPTQMSISGITFSNACGNDSTTGHEYVENYYNTYCASNYPAPLTIVIGTTGASIHTGFLVGHSSRIANSENRIGEFTLHFLCLPKLTAKAVSG